MHVETYSEARAELKKIAARILKEQENATLNHIMRETYNEAREITIGHAMRTLSGNEAEQTVKARVTIGRCWNHAGVKAFWMPKGQRLGDARCPYCSGHLNQTTLALRAVFERLPK